MQVGHLSNLQLRN